MSCEYHFHHGAMPPPMPYMDCGYGYYYNDFSRVLAGMSLFTGAVGMGFSIASLFRPQVNTYSLNSQYMLGIGQAGGNKQPAKEGQALTTLSSSYPNYTWSFVDGMYYGHPINGGEDIIAKTFAEIVAKLNSLGETQPKVEEENDKFREQMMRDLNITFEGNKYILGDMKFDSWEALIEFIKSGGKTNTNIEPKKDPELEPETEKEKMGIKKYDETQCKTYTIQRGNYEQTIISTLYGVKYMSPEYEAILKVLKDNYGYEHGTNLVVGNDFPLPDVEFEGKRLSADLGRAEDIKTGVVAPNSFGTSRFTIQKSGSYYVIVDNKGQESGHYSSVEEAKKAIEDKNAEYVATT